MNEHHPVDARPFFIERGSTVRVRQRALKAPQIRGFVLSGLNRR
jgi:hypothetical protein